MITRSDLLSINDKYREWLVNDDALPPERDLSVQLHVKQEKTLESKQIKQEKTLDSNQALGSNQTKREKTLDSGPDIDI